MLALTFPLNRMVGRTFIPSEDMGEFTVHIDTPQGTSLEGTTAIARQVVEEVRGQEGVARVAYLAGADRGNHFHIMFYLQPPDEREVSQDDVIARIRRILAAHPGYAPIVTARNPLAAAAGAAAAISPSRPACSAPISPSCTTTRSSCCSARSSRRAWWTRNPRSATPARRCTSRWIGRSAADLGVRISTIGSALRLMVSGDDEISTFRDGGEQYPVKIRVLENQRRDIDAIGKLTVPSSTGEQVRIDNIAQMDRGFGPTQLRRQNRQFAIDVQGDIAPATRSTRRRTTCAG